jgi:hypothetical protein
MTKERKYKFNFLLIDQDIRLVDQNVIEWRFINIGGVDALINNNFLLEAPKLNTFANCIFDENLKTNQKTAQSYSIVFVKNQQLRPKIQVIQKIEVFD